MSCVIILQALCLSEVTTGDFFMPGTVHIPKQRFNSKKHFVNEIIHTFRLKPTVSILYSVYCTVSALSPRAGFHILYVT